MSTNDQTFVRCSCPFGCLTQIGDSPAIILDRIALENCRAGDENVSAAPRAISGAVSTVTPPSTSSSIGRSPISDFRRRDLLRHRRMNFWPPKPGIDRHDQDEIDIVEHVSRWR